MNEPTFHAGSKLAWIEQIAIDRNSSHFEVRVALAISRRLLGAGEAYASQETLANTIGASVRGVRKAIVALREHGHLDVNIAGVGRGHATVYRPIVKRRNGGSSFQAEKRNEKTRNSEALKAEQECTKSGTTVPPKIPGCHLSAQMSERGARGMSWIGGSWRIPESGTACARSISKGAPAHYGVRAIRCQRALPTMPNGSLSP